MPILAQCPLCGVRLKVPDQYAGRGVKCPGCKQLIQIPVPEGDQAEGAVAGSAIYRPSKAALPELPQPVASRRVVQEPIPRESDELSGSPGNLPESFRGQTFSPMLPPSAPQPKTALPNLGGLPIWGWVLVVSALSGLLGGLVVYASLKLSGSGQASRTPTAQADRSKSLKSSPAEKKQPSSADQSSATEAPKSPGSQPSSSKTGKSVREILDAVVKLEMPREPGKMSIGAGFFIDPRGWVATNYHVVRQATSATRVRLVDGTQCKVAGILAQEPSMDLAILKLADPPPRLSVLDISFPTEPEIGEEIQVCGHPHNLSFTVDKGTVGRVVTTLEMIRERGNPLLVQMHAPQDMLWIQHSARIAPGNSGGPVLNQQGQVVGVNSFINELSFGYAVPVRYLRAMLASCDENKLIPLPDQLPSSSSEKPQPNQPPQQPQEPQPPSPSPNEPVPKPPAANPPPGQLTLSPEELQKLYDACCQFYWKPQTPEQYRDVEQFARAVTMVKHLQAHPESAPGASKEAITACVEKADQLFKRLQESPWTKDHWDKIHALAADHLQEGQGILLRGSILMNAEQIHGPRPTILFAPEGIDRKLLLLVNSDQAKLPVGTKVWLIGRIVGTAQLSSNQGSSETCLLGQVAYLVKEE